MVDVVLIGLEGVLFDTRSLRRASLRGACAAHGVTLATDAELDVSLPVKASLNAAMSRAGMPLDDVVADLIERDAEQAFTSRLSVGGVALQPSARSFIDRAASDVRLAVVTRARRDDADAMLHLSGFDAAFSCVVTADDTLDAKPSPAGIRLALERLAKLRSVSPASAISLEDGVAGIRAARAARVRCLAVGAVPPHIAIEADAYVETLGEHTPGTLDALSLPGRERVQ
jgi:beta-phosphoglucomutase-like phosphatase (HAD superfamily)